jgi:hypothetical protein
MCHLVSSVYLSARPSILHSAEFSEFRHSEFRHSEIGNPSVCELLRGTMYPRLTVPSGAKGHRIYLVSI